MKREIFHTLVVALSILFAVGCEKDVPQDTIYTPRTAEGVILKECPVIHTVYSDTTYMLTEGLHCTELHIETMKGQTQHLFLAFVDMNEPSLGLKVATPYDMEVLNLTQTPVEMAAAADRAGQRVLVLTNGDFFNTSTLALRGPLHRRGKILKSTFLYDPALPQQALSCVGVKADGTMTVADAVDYPAIKDELVEAMGGGVVFLRDESIYTPYTALDPRTAIGFNNETGMACLLCVDGRSMLWSSGMTYAELGNVMLSLGMTDAVNLDGGGSTQFLVKNPVAGAWQIRNRPADGAHRAITSGWMVTADMP